MLAPQPIRTSTEDTRTKILSAAREIFSVKGPHGSTTREIADRAGVNEATLFRHFGNKNALLAAMKEHFCQQKEARIRALYESLTGDIREDMLALARSMIGGMKESRDLIRVSMLEEAADPEASSIPWRASQMARSFMTSYLEEHVRKGTLQGKPEIMARMFMGIIFSYVMGLRLWEASDITDDDVAAQTFVNLFLDGARSRTK